MQSRNRYRLLLLTIGLIVLIVVWGLLHHKTPTKSTGTYTDPLSHEVVSNPSGKTPESYGTSPNTPLYLGFDKLLHYGITLNQLNEIKQAFYTYSSQQSKPLSQVSIDVDHITTSHDPKVNNSPFVILFNVQFNGSGDISQTKAQYTGLRDMELILLKDNKVFFDSGKLGGQE